MSAVVSFFYKDEHNKDPPMRNWFRKRMPRDWGCGTSAWQIEGAPETRGKCIWDQGPGTTDCRGCDHYHHFREDFEYLSRMKLTAYRCSLSWARLWPHGDAALEPSPDGVRFYKQVFAELKRRSLRIVVTLFHWDYPSALQERGGWAHEDAPRWFETYASACARLFGTDVDAWVTLNEPWTFVVHGYCTRLHAPAPPNDARDVYLVAHRLLQAHALAFYALKRITPDVPVLLALNTDWMQPASAQKHDKEAAQRALDFTLGWFADPILTGDYPASMRERLPQLPFFLPKDRIKGTWDQFGLNYYSAQMVSSVNPGSVARALVGHQGLLRCTLRHGLDDPRKMFSCGHFSKMGVMVHSPPGPKTTMGWAICPWGLTCLLEYVGRRYKLPIVITENGIATHDDEERIEFVKTHVQAMMRANADVVGYYLWSLLDNVEWAHGNTQRFGCVRVDFDNGMQRTPRPIVDEMARRDEW